MGTKYTFSQQQATFCNADHFLAAGHQVVEPILDINLFNELMNGGDTDMDWWDQIGTIIIMNQNVPTAPAGVEDINGMDGSTGRDGNAFAGDCVNNQVNALHGQHANQPLWHGHMNDPPQPAPALHNAQCIPVNGLQNVHVPAQSNALGGLGLPSFADNTLKTPSLVDFLMREIHKREVEILQLRQAATAVAPDSASSPTGSLVSEDSDIDDDAMKAGGGLKLSPLRLHWPAKSDFIESLQSQWTGLPKGNPNACHIARLISAARGGPIRCYVQSYCIWVVLHADVVRVDVSLRAYASGADPDKAMFWKSLYRGTAAKGRGRDFVLGDEGYTAVALDLKRFNAKTGRKEGLGDGWKGHDVFTGGRRKTYEFCLVAWTRATEDKAAVSDHIEVWCQPQHH